MKRALLAALLTLFACGGSTDATDYHNDAGDAAALDGATFSPDASPDAGGEVDAGCWRCADRAWRNVCTHPAEVADDAMSCLMCGEHCNSTPDAGVE